MDDPASTLPFVAETLSALRKEIDGQATLLGFVGTPWTLAAYAMEGKADKHLLKTKTIMYHGETWLPILCPVHCRVG
jgi:uroporphyrinogen decarboxylase